MAVTGTAKVTLGWWLVRRDSKHRITSPPGSCCSLSTEAAAADQILCWSGQLTLVKRVRQSGRGGKSHGQPESLQAWAYRSQVVPGHSIQRHCPQRAPAHRGESKPERGRTEGAGYPLQAGRALCPLSPSQALSPINLSWRSLRTLWHSSATS